MPAYLGILSVRDIVTEEAENIDRINILWIRSCFGSKFVVVIDLFVKWRRNIPEWRGCEQGRWRYCVLSRWPNIQTFMSSTMKCSGLNRGFAPQRYSRQLLHCAKWKEKSVSMFFLGDPASKCPRLTFKWPEKTYSDLFLACIMYVFILWGGWGVGRGLDSGIRSHRYLKKIIPGSGNLTMLTYFQWKIFFRFVLVAQRKLHSELHSWRKSTPSPISKSNRGEGNFANRLQGCCQLSGKHN